MNRRLWWIGLTVGVAGLSYAGYSTMQKTLRPPTPRLALAKGEELLTNSPRVLAISAHPDDLEFFAGGLLCRLIQRGAEVVVVDVTNGELGTNTKDLSTTRQEEQRAAGQILGYRSVYFLKIPDLQVATEFPIATVAEIYKQVQPTLIITFDPETPLAFLRHPDHLAIGQGIKDLVQQVGYQGNVLYYATARPNLTVDITSVMDRKVKAVLAHKSQLRISPRIYPRLVKGYHHLASCHQARYVESLRLVSFS